MNKNVFKSAKEKYEQIKAPKDLEKSVNDIFNKKKIYVFSKIMLSTVASVFVCFVCALNVNPVFARNVANNDFMRNIVNVLTIKKYEVKDENISARIVTPKIVGMTDEEIEEKINNEIDSMINDIINEFEKGAEELKENYPDAHYGVDAGYIVKTDNDKYLSVDIYVVNMVGSSSTKHKFYNIDKQQGTEIKLKDIFTEENYIENLAQIITKEIEERNKLEGHEIYFATYDDIKSLLSQKEEFYINENGNLVIVFDKYEIGIGAIGSPEFEITK